MKVKAMSKITVVKCQEICRLQSVLVYLLDVFEISSSHQSKCYTCSSSSSLPSPCASSSSLHSPLSNCSPLMPKLAIKPNRAMPPKTPHATASPLGRTSVASVKRPPDRKGPSALPPAERVCARPFRVPRTE